MGLLALSVPPEQKESETASSWPPLVQPYRPQEGSAEASKVEQVD